MNYKQAMNIVTNPDVFQDQAAGHLCNFESFNEGTEWKRFWDSKETASDWFNNLNMRTDISQDDKWEIDECYPQLLLLELLRNFK